MENASVLDALIDQVACYRRLAKLAAVQHDHIQNGRTEELLAVLQSRQQVLDQLERHERAIAPVKKEWPQYLDGLTAAARQQAETLMAETKTLLEQITNADRNDVLVLQQRKLNIGKKINKTTAAKQVNRNYAAAAYTSSRPRMDLQM
jgi:FlgN protein